MLVCEMLSLVSLSTRIWGLNVLPIDAGDVLSKLMGTIQPLEVNMH